MISTKPARADCVLCARVLSRVFLRFFSLHGVCVRAVFLTESGASACSVVVVCVCYHIMALKLSSYTHTHTHILSISQCATLTSITL